MSFNYNAYHYYVRALEQGGERLIPKIGGSTQQKHLEGKS